MRSRSNLLGNAILTLVSISVTLVLCEVILRFVFPDITDASPYYDISPEWNLPDVELGYVRKPNLAWEGRALPDPLAHHVTYRTDENGFRNSTGISKADIVFVGDSFVEAGNVPEADTFVQLAGAALRKTVVNLGRARYGPREERIVMDRYAFGYGPETLIWTLFEGNDLRDAEYYYYGGRMQPAHIYCELDAPEARGVVWFDHCELYELGPPPAGDEWQQGPTSAFNKDDFLRAHVIGENLLPNGSFETGTNGLAYWLGGELEKDITVEQDAAGPVDGQFSLRIELPGDRQLWLRQRLDALEPGKQYLLRGWIKTKDLGGQVFLAVGSTDRDQPEFQRYGQALSGTNDWTQQGLVFTIPDHPIKFNVFLRRRTTDAPPKSRWNVLRTTALIHKVLGPRPATAGPNTYLGMPATFRTASGDTLDIGFQYKFVPDMCAAYPAGWRATERCLREGLAACQSRHIQPIVLYIPVKIRIEGPRATFQPESPDQLETWVPGGRLDLPDTFAAATESLCQELGCPFVSATEALRQKAETGIPVYSARYDSHLDIEGHKVVADLLAAALAGSG